MSRIDDLIERQAEELARLDDREVKSLLRALDDARRDLGDRLRSIAPGKTPFSAQRFRVALVQVQAAQAQLLERLSEQLGTSIRTVDDRALADTLAVIRRAERKFRDAGGAIEFSALRKMAESRDLQLAQVSTSLRRYGAALVDDIHRQLVLGVTSGDTLDELVDRIAGTNGLFVQNRGRAELIARMELNAAYNRANQAVIEELAAGDAPNDPDPMLRKACEFRDLRNNAISRVLNGMLVGVSEPFRVPFAKVAAENARLNAARAAAHLPARRLGGIVWPLQGRGGIAYVGFNYPAHFRDRGRIVPWRRSWDQSPKAVPPPTPTVAKIVEKDVDRDAILAKVRTAHGEIEFTANMSTDPDGALRLKQLHVSGIDGVKQPNALGPRILKEYVEALARDHGVTEVVIEGGERRTGAAVGRAGTGPRKPKELRFKLK